MHWRRGFGSNRLLAENVGRLLGGCSWVGVAFAGGMCEVPHIKARTIVVNDVHRHLINLARAVAKEHACNELIAKLNETMFHPDVLAESQTRCAEREQNVERFLENHDPDGCSINWAFDFMVSVWMARNATAGTRKEFDAPLSVRWDAAGGDSVVRFRHAAEGLKWWFEEFKRCTFVCLDWVLFLGKCKDQPGHGVYLDPPFPGPGDSYKHTFGEVGHRNLAARLAEYKQARIVARFYDVPLIRELYPEPMWTWHMLEGRKQSNAKAAEVLLVKNG